MKKKLNYLLLLSLCCNIRYLTAVDVKTVVIKKQHKSAVATIPGTGVSNGNGGLSDLILTKQKNKPNTSINLV